MPGLVPGIHVCFPTHQKTWMAGTSPAMTASGTENLTDGYRRQTGATAAASSEMAVVRPARTVPDDRLRCALLRIFAVGDGRHRHANHRSSLALAAGSHLYAVHLRDLHWCCGGHPPKRSSVSDGDLRSDARHAADDRRDHHSYRRARRVSLSDLVRLHQLPPWVR